MTELKVDFPVKLNGVIITDYVHHGIADLQTGSTLDNEKPDYNNSGIANMNEYIAELNNYFIEIMALANIGEDTDREKEMLSHLYLIRERINLCKVPNELLSIKK